MTRITSTPEATTRLPLLSTALLLLLAQSCTPENQAPTAEAPTAVTETTTDTTETPSETTAPVLTLETGESLSPFSADDLTLLTTEGEQLTQNWIALAGLGKADIPTFAGDLQTFRQMRQTEYPEAAPFIGLWQDDGSALVPHSLIIFPTAEAGQVCLLEYRPELKVVETVETERIFSLSTATVTEGELRTSRLRTTQAATRQAEFEGGIKVPLLDVLDAENNVKVYALRAAPALPSDLSEAMQAEATQALSTAGCIVDDFN